MATVPRIQEPPQPGPEKPNSIADASRSKLRSFFYRRKASNGSLRSNTQLAVEFAHQESAHNDRRARPTLNPRSRSAIAQCPSLSKAYISERRSDRARDKVLTDPPPLAQVHSQAILHASLETPTAFVEKSRGRQASSLPNQNTSREQDQDTVEVKRLHNRTDSRESSCSTRAKTFFLINGPYVLQYDGDATGDALPEKILVLDRDSVAITCDAVPGRRHVLQVSKHSAESPTQVHGQRLRPSWSLLTLRRSEERRTVDTLLLIFDDSEELYTWLFAIRREIEHLGGMDFGTGSGDDDQTWRDDLTKRYASPPQSQSDSRKSSTTRVTSPIASPISPSLRTRGPRSAIFQTGSRRTSASSRKSLNSLDRLRDSGTSGSYTSTLATSASSRSPTCEKFPSINAVADHPCGSLALRAYPLNNETNFQSLKSMPRSKSLLQRRKLSVNSLQLVEQEQMARKVLPDLPSTKIGPLNDESPNFRSYNARDSTQSGNSTEIRQPTTTKPSPGQAFSDTRPNTANASIPLRKASIANSNSGSHTGKYSLFPVRASREVKHEPLASPLALVSPGSWLSPAATSSMPSQQTSRPRHQKSRSRTVTLELRQHRVSALLGAGEVGLSQRSPAATDAMILSNFGVMNNRPPVSPMPETRVPGLADLNFDLDFLKTPHQKASTRQSARPITRRTDSVRSNLSQKSESSAALAKASAGPPPAGPLPAVPSSSPHSSQIHRSSQRSQPAQINVVPQSFGQVGTDPQGQAITFTEEPPSYENATRDSRNMHRRTISSSLDGPPPSAWKQDTQPEQTNKARSRNRSRGRRKPTRTAP